MAIKGQHPKQQSVKNESDHNTSTRPIETPVPMPQSVVESQEHDHTLTKQQMIDMLERSVTEWNQWRKQNPYVEIDLKGADLEGANLKGANLKGAYLTGANLNGANLVVANLVVANLKWAELEEANLQGADLTMANLQDACLYGINLQGADLTMANLQDAHLQELSFLGDIAQVYHLWGVNTGETALEKANLQNAHLFGANLQNAHLFGVDLQEADLTKANLQEAFLSGANLSGANLNGVYLHNANLTKATLTAANLNNANVSGVIYNRKKMVGKYQGIHVDSCHGNAVFRRDAQDQDYIDSLWTNTKPCFGLFIEHYRKADWIVSGKRELVDNSKWIGLHIWRIFTDYGRNIIAVLLFALVTVYCFGAIYHLYPNIGLAKHHSFGMNGQSTLLGALWYSFTTFITLNHDGMFKFGSPGHICAVIEIMAAYFALGLIATFLFSTVMRRS